MCHEWVSLEQFAHVRGRFISPVNIGAGDLAIHIIKGSEVINAIHKN